MTHINGHPPKPPVTPPTAQQIETQSGEALNGRSTRQHQGQQQASGGNARSQSSLMVSQSALERLLETPERQTHAQDDTGDEKPQQDPHEDVQILITLGPDAGALKDAPVGKTAVAADMQTKVDEIAKTLTRQLDAAQRVGPVVTPHPISLALPMQPGTGLQEVKVTLNGDVLSVTIVRDPAQVDVDMKQAALNLAQILQSRYPTKTIKIAEQVADAVTETDAPADKGDPLIAALSNARFNDGRDER